MKNKRHRLSVEKMESNQGIVFECLKQIRIEAWQGSGDKGYVVLDDVFFMQTKETPTNSSSTNNGSNNSITSSTSSSNKDTFIPTITEQTSTTPTGMANATKPISALDKATFPFPCYLEVVSIFSSLVKEKCIIAQSDYAHSNTL